MSKVTGTPPFSFFKKQRGRVKSNRHDFFFLSEYYVAKAMLIGMQKINNEKHEAKKTGMQKKRHETRKDRYAVENHENMRKEKIGMPQQQQYTLP